MSPRDIAIWINSESSNEDFLEMFSCLSLAMNGRGIPDEYDKKEIIKNMEVNSMLKRLNEIVTDVRKDWIEDTYYGGRYGTD